MLWSVIWTVPCSNNSTGNMISWQWPGLVHMCVLCTCLCMAGVRILHIHVLHFCLLAMLIVQDCFTLHVFLVMYISLFVHSVLHTFSEFPQYEMETLYSVKFTSLYRTHRSRVTSFLGYFDKRQFSATQGIWWVYMFMDVQAFTE